MAYRVLRALPPVSAGVVWEAVHTDEPDSRAILWPGAPPELPLPAMAGLGRRGGVVLLSGSPMWVEHCCVGALLSELPLPLPRSLGAAVGAWLTRIVSALHTAGLVHGDVSAQRIAVGRDGTLELLGCGVEGGSPEGDVEALERLVGLLMGDEGHEPGDRTLAGLMETLVDQAAGLDPAVELASLVGTFGSSWVQEGGPDSHSLDEVAVEIGHDEQAIGLLDVWERFGGTDESSGDRTGTQSGDMSQEQRRLAVMARLSAELSRVPAAMAERASQEGQPCTRLKALIADEPLDPLPVPDGLPAPIAGAHEELSVEVTVVRGDPDWERTAVVAAQGRGPPSEGRGPPSEVTQSLEPITEGLGPPTALGPPTDTGERTGSWPTAVESLPRSLFIGAGALLVLVAGLLALLVSMI